MLDIHKDFKALSLDFSLYVAVVKVKGPESAHTERDPRKRSVEACKNL